MEINDSEFVKNLDGWLAYNEQGYAKFLSTNKPKIPTRFRTYSGTLYRGMVVTPEILHKIEVSGFYQLTGYSSWTKDKNIARSFINDDKYRISRTGTIKLIISKKIPANIIIDIDSYAKITSRNQMIQLEFDDMSADSALKEQEVLIDKGIKITKSDIELFLG